MQEVNWRMKDKAERAAKCVEAFAWSPQPARPRRLKAGSRLRLASRPNRVTLPTAPSPAQNAGHFSMPMRGLQRQEAAEGAADHPPEEPGAAERPRSKL